MIIYKAENKANGKIYVGQTSRLLNERIEQHIRDSKKHKYPFANAIRKYGISNFEWTVLMKCISRQELDEMEKYFIANYRATNYLYNLTDGGNGQSGRECTKETREKISKSLKGNKLSEETKRKLSVKLKGRRKPPRTQDHINKIVQARKGKKFPHTKEWNDKISVSLKGHFISEETRKKISKTLQGNKNARK